MFGWPGRPNRASVGKLTYGLLNTTKYKTLMLFNNK